MDCFKAQNGANNYEETRFFRPILAISIVPIPLRAMRRKFPIFRHANFNAQAPFDCVLSTGSEAYLYKGTPTLFIFFQKAINFVTIFLIVIHPYLTVFTIIHRPHIPVVFRDCIVYIFPHKIRCFCIRLTIYD